MPGVDPAEQRLHQPVDDLAAEPVLDSQPTLTSWPSSVGRRQPALQRRPGPARRRRHAAVGERAQVARDAHQRAAASAAAARATTGAAPMVAGCTSVVAEPDRPGQVDRLGAPVEHRLRARRRRRRRRPRRSASLPPTAADASRTMTVGTRGAVRRTAAAAASPAMPPPTTTTCGAGSRRHGSWRGGHGPQTGSDRSRDAQPAWNRRRDPAASQPRQRGVPRRREDGGRHAADTGSAGRGRRRAVRPARRWPRCSGGGSGGEHGRRRGVGRQRDRAAPADRASRAGAPDQPRHRRRRPGRGRADAGRSIRTGELVDCTVTDVGAGPPPRSTACSRRVGGSVDDEQTTDDRGRHASSARPSTLRVPSTGSRRPSALSGWAGSARRSDRVAEDVTTEVIDIDEPGADPAEQPRPAAALLARANDVGDLIATRGRAHPAAGRPASR